MPQTNPFRPFTTNSIVLALLILAHDEVAAVRLPLRTSKASDNLVHHAGVSPASGHQAFQGPGSAVQLFERCAAKNVYNKRAKLAAVNVSNSRSSKLGPCETGTRTGRWSEAKDGTISYVAECCNVKGYCSGCADASNNRCAECMTGYSLIGQSGYQKCALCDDTNWADAVGNTCSDYERLGICKLGQAPLVDEPFQGLRPSDACCACGGGDLTPTPWKYQLSKQSIVPGQEISERPSPQTAFRYEIEPGCTLTRVGLQMDADGRIFGKIPETLSEDATDISCTVTAVQDPLRSITYTAPLQVRVQSMSYGPRVITFAFQDGADYPIGKRTYELLKPPTLNLQGFQLNCVPIVPWIEIRYDGALMFKDGASSNAVSGGLSGDMSGMDGGQCSLTARSDKGLEVKMSFAVLKVHIWKHMHYNISGTVHARKGVPIVPLPLDRVPPPGFKVHIDKQSGQKFWYKTQGGMWIPPAIPPQVIDVKCKGTDFIKWSRQTGMITIRGQPAFRLDPQSGEISGKPELDLPESLGLSKLEVECIVAASNDFYQDVLQATVKIRIVDDTCFFKQQVKAGTKILAMPGFQGGGSCAMQCKKRPDCGGYWEANGCWLQTSRHQNGGQVKTGVNELIVRAMCEEGGTCLQVDAEKARYLDGQYCPKGHHDDKAIYTRSGLTEKDEYYLSSEPCPLLGRTGKWVVRRAGATDYMNPETQRWELRGEPLACFKDEIEYKAFELGHHVSKIYLAQSAFIGTQLSASQYNSNLQAQVTLTSQPCTLSAETTGSGRLFGTIDDPEFYTLDPCECFGKAYRDQEDVTEDSRNAANHPSSDSFNLFNPPPTLLFEGPYVCEEDAVLPNVGQKNEIDEDDCRSECFQQGSACKYFMYVAQLRFCLLLSKCDRIGNTGLELTNKLFGVFPKNEQYCHIADPEACWIQEGRRTLLEGRFYGDASEGGIADGFRVQDDKENCAFQSILAQCDAMQMATTEKHGSCAHCAWYHKDSKKAEGRRKEPPPTTFPPASQIATACPVTARLLHKKTGKLMEKAVMTCVDGAWRDSGTFEGISATSSQASTIEVIEAPQRKGDSVFFGSADTWSDLGYFQGKDFLYVKGSERDKSTRADSPMWTIQVPIPVVVYLGFWGGESHTEQGCKDWLKGSNSRWIKTTLAGAEFGGKGPGIVYKQDFPSGLIQLFGAAGSKQFYVFIEPALPDMEDALDRLTCQGCIQLAQPQYAEYLKSSSPEIYFLQRRKMQYHYGETIRGCKKSTTYSHLASMYTNSAGQLVCLGSSLASKTGSSCGEADKWLFNDRGQIVSKNGQCLARSGTSVTKGGCGAGDNIWEMTDLGQLTNPAGDKCYQRNGGMVNCADPVNENQQWYFEGGDCRYDMALQSTDKPLMWKFKINGNYWLGAETRVDPLTTLSAAKAKIDQDALTRDGQTAAYGTCLVSTAAVLTAVDMNVVRELDLLESSREETKYFNKAFMWKVGGSAAYVCAPGGSGGIGAISEAVAAKKEKQEKIASIEGDGGCQKAKHAPMPTARNTNWRNGWDGHMNVYESGKVVTGIYSVHDNGREDRRFALSTAALDTVGGTNGNPVISVSGETTVFPENGWDGTFQHVCPANWVMTGLESWHDNGKEDRKFKFRCNRLANAVENERKEWTTANGWDSPNEVQTAAEDFIIGMWSWHDDGREDRQFRWLQASYCLDRSAEIQGIRNQIAELDRKIEEVCRTESTCSSDFSMRVEDILNMEVSYPSGGVTAKMSNKCHLIRRGDPGNDKAYTMTAPQLTDMVRAVEYHGTVGQDPAANGVHDPFGFKPGAPVHNSMYIGYFAQIDNAATLWGIKCPKGSVVAVHSAVNSPHCLHVGASGKGELVIGNQLPDSAKCDLGYAIGGWYNLPGHSVVKKNNDVGGPQTFRGFEIICRPVPGLSRLCEETENACKEDEVVSGINYNDGKSIAYRCCKVPKTVGHLFATRTLTDIKNWEGYYCPTGLDDSGRPVYEAKQSIGATGKWFQKQPGPNKDATLAWDKFKGMWKLKISGESQTKDVESRAANPEDIGGEKDFVSDNDAVVPWVAAPIVDFKASFVQVVAKADPFPKEKPTKPELLKFQAEEPEYDKFCDIEERKFIGEGSDEDETPEDGHPCLHTYQNRMNEQKFWDCSQRDIDRGYLADVAEAQHAKYDAEMNKFEFIFEMVEMGVSIVAAAAGAIPWGSYAVPAEEGAEGAVEMTEETSKKAAGVAIGKMAKLKNQNLGQAMAKKMKNWKKAGSLGARKAKKAALDFGKAGANAAAAATPHIQGAIARGASGKSAEDSRNADAMDAAYGSQLMLGDNKDIPALPEIKSPDQFGFSEATNAENFGLAGWTDCDPIQNGLSKIMCDLYCTEEAVKKGTSAVLDNIEQSQKILTTNLQRLLDYHSRLLLWGMGQLRDQLLKELLPERTNLLAWNRGRTVKGRNPDGAAPADVQGILADLETLPVLISTNATLRAAPSRATIEWHDRASKDVLARVHKTLGVLTKKNARPRIHRARRMLQKFNAEVALKMSHEAPPKAEAIEQMTSDKTHAIKGHIERQRRGLHEAAISPKPMHFGGLELKSDEVIVRWNQLADYFVKAHERHAVFVESRGHALDMADETVDAVQQYMSCGEDLGDLKETWDSTARVEEQTAENLMEAWAATVASQERLQMAVDQGLLERVVESIDLEKEEVEAAECGDMALLTKQVHKVAIRAVDKSLWPLTEQILALEQIAKYQQEQLHAKKLKGVPRVALDGTVVAIYRVAQHAADPSHPAGRALAAKALNLLGPRLCAAPHGCSGMQLFNASFGAWVAKQPGDLLLGKAAEDVATPCFAHPKKGNPMEELMPVLFAYEHGLVSATEVEEAREELKAKHKGDLAPECDAACKLRLQLSPAAQPSVIAQLWLKMR